MIGLVGLMLSALMIAVLTQKLFLTREEKYLHTFVLNRELAEKHRLHAATVVKFSVQVWYLKQKTNSHSKLLRAQHHLFESICNVEEVKKDRSVTNNIEYTS